MCVLACFERVWRLPGPCQTPVKRLWSPGTRLWWALRGAGSPCDWSPRPLPPQALAVAAKAIQASDVGTAAQLASLGS